MSKTSFISFFCFLQAVVLLANPNPTPIACNISVDAGPDHTVCNPGEQVQLSGFVSDPFASYSWTPTTGLSNPNSLNPTLTVTGNATYVLQAQVIDPVNLVVNGDFNQGAVGFTSDYIPGTGGTWGLLSNEGQYAVANDPAATHTNFSSCSDHTGDATGNMMVINGAAVANQSVWCQTVAVTPGTNYEFSAWVAMVINSSPAILQFSINGTLIGNVLNAPPTPCAWVPFSAPWNSGSLTSAEICIVNQNTNPSGNDFALDDITFNEVCTATDEVNIVLNQAQQTFISETVCPDNNCVLVNNNVYCGTGNYTIDLQTSQGCDSTVFLTILENTPVILNTPVDMITCNNPSVFIQPIVNTNGQVVNWQWSGPNGFLSLNESILVSQPGIYGLTIQVVLNGVVCTTSQDFIVLENMDLPIADAGPDIALACGDTFPVTLNGSNSFGQNITYNWTGPGLNSSDVAVDVNQAGTYNLIITDLANGCQSVDVVLVSESGQLPEISIAGGTIDCNNPVVELNGESTTPGVTYSWTGPNAFTSALPNPSVTDPGTYFLNIALGPNCSVLDSILVLEDISIPEVSGNSTPITCENISSTLTVVNPDPDLSYQWSGPNGFSAMGTMTSTLDTGTYVLTAIAQNGCVDSVSISTISLAEFPNILASADSINCDNTVASLNGSSTNQNISVEWSGPNGFSSSNPNTTTSVAGNYLFLVVDNTNGCASIQAVEVFEDITEPDLTTFNDTLNCNIQELNLQAASTDGISFNWTGPNAFSSQELNPLINEAGEYIITAIGGNGCSSNETVTITLDDAAPDIQTSNALIACSETETTLIASSINGTSYEWTGPNGFTAQELTPTVSDTGSYTLTIFGDNGCSANANTEVSLNNEIIDLTLSGGTLSCTENSIMLSAQSNYSIESYSWTGPGGFSSTSAAPEVGQEGTYTLTVSTIAGCTTSDTTQVLADENLPNISATGGTIYCDPNEVMLVGNSTETDVSFLWEGPNGFSTTDLNPTVETPGDYTFSVSAQNGCIAIQEVEVLIENDLPSIQASGNTIGCGESETQIQASAIDGINFEWYGPNGFISNLENPLVNDIGEYTVIVTSSNGCTDSLSVMVASDGAVPEIQLQGGTLDCDNDNVQLSVNSPDQIETYLWTGPGGFTSPLSNPIVSQPGNYTLTVTTPSGCETSELVTVDEDGDLPGYTLDPELIIPCDASNVTLPLVLDDPNTSVAWTGAFGFNSTQVQPVVPGVGTYQVTLTSNNGCATQSSTVVVSDTFSLDYTTSAAGITCTNSVGSASVIVNNFQEVGWVNTSGYSELGTTAFSSIADTFTFTIVDWNGCTESVEVAVSADLNLPVISTQDVHINCEMPNAILQTSSNIALDSYTWTGPGGFFSNDANPAIENGGQYTLIAETADGCTGTAAVNVTADFVAPTINLNSTIIDCQATASTISASSNDPNAAIFWTGPNNFMASGAMQQVNESGFYQATAISENGCSASDNVEVIQDNQVPELSINNPVLNCNNPNDMLVASATILGGDYAWYSNEILIGASESLPITQGGNYEVSYTLANGCIASESIFVDSDFEAPQVQLSNGFINCTTPTFNPNPVSTGTILSWNWDGPNNFQSNNSNPPFAAEGIYNLEVIADNGCSFNTALQIEADFTTPAFSLSNALIDCNNPSVELTPEGSISAESFSWTGPNGFSSIDVSPEISDGGNYYLEIIGANGCVQNLEAFVEVDTLLPTFSILGDEITCSNPTVNLELAGTSILGQYNWTGPNGFNAISESIAVDEIGTYTLALTPDNGCINEQSFNVEADLELPIINTTGGVLDCTTDEVILSATVFETGLFSWLDDAGNSYNTMELSVDQAGSYTFQFQADDNGCASEAVELVLQEEDLLSDLDIIQPLCVGENGNVFFGNTTGGTAPYFYSVDGGQTFETTTPSGEFQSGNYQYIIQDSGDCLWDSTFTIATPSNIFIQLLSSLEIEYGDEINLVPQFSFPEEEIQSVQWSPSNGLSCTDCLTPTASPTQDTEYRITVTTEDGCSTASQIFLRVQNEKNVYIPNAFSPDGNGSNDIFTIYGDQQKIRQVDLLIIYDRWGEEVFRAENFPVNDLQFGWNGILNGEALNPAVFVYYTELTFIDDSQQSFKGDVTLIR